MARLAREVARLVDFVFDRFARRGCDHVVRKYFRRRALGPMATEDALDWLKRHGGYCDCEIVLNVGEQFG